MIGTFGLLLEASGNRRRRGMAVAVFQASGSGVSPRTAKDDSQDKTRLTGSLGEFLLKDQLSILRCETIYVAVCKNLSLVHLELNWLPRLFTGHVCI